MLKLTASLGVNLQVCREAAVVQAPDTSHSATSWGSSVSGSSQLSPEVLRGSLIQPLSIHDAEISHVALVGVEQLSVYDAGWLAVEEDR